MRVAFLGEGGRNLREVLWTKAHVREKLPKEVFDALPEGAQWEARCNDAADEAAKMGRLVHEQPTSEQAAKLERLVEDQKAVFLLAAAVLRLWPRLPSGLERFPAGRPAVPRQRSLPEEELHRWGPLERGWRRCERCCRATRPHLVRRRQKCPGRAKLLGATHWSHPVRCFRVGGEVLLACFACGAFGTKHARLLADTCTGRLPANRAKALKRVERGWHPSDRPHLRGLRLDDGEGPGRGGRRGTEPNGDSAAQLQGDGDGSQLDGEPPRGCHPWWAEGVRVRPWRRLTGKTADANAGWTAAEPPGRPRRRLTGKTADANADWTAAAPPGCAEGAGAEAGLGPPADAGAGAGLLPRRAASSWEPAWRPEEPALQAPAPPRRRKGPPRCRLSGPWKKGLDLHERGAPPGGAGEPA